MRTEPLLISHFYLSGCTLIELAVKQVVEFGQTLFQPAFHPFESARFFRLYQLQISKFLIGLGNLRHLLVNKWTEFGGGKRVAIVQIIIQFLFSRVTHQSVAAANIEVDVGQRVQSQVFVTLVHIHHRHHLQEEAQLGDFGGLHHNVHPVKVSQDDALVNEILDVTTVLVFDFVQLDTE